MEIKERTALPSEVLENIFYFLDGRTFCVARQVCKSWNTIIKEMELKNLLWKEFCIREASKDILEEIGGFKSISCSETKWKSVYIKYFQSNIILSSSFWKRKVNAFLQNPINCIAVSGSRVLTGHSNGLLCSWNLETGELYEDFLCHLRAINDMAIVDLMNLGSFHGAERLSWDHHHVITISKDRYINVASLLEPFSTNADLYNSYHGDELKQIKVFGDLFAVASADNTVSLWKMVLDFKLLRLTINQIIKIIGPPDFLFSIGLWNSELQCVTYAGKLKTYHHSNNEWIEKKYFKDSYSESGSESIVSVTAALLFRSKTVVMLTADGKLILSAGENYTRHYLPITQLLTSVVSVALHGPILALGGENGKLFLFYLANDEELLDLNLSKPVFTLSLSEASIIAIHIAYQHDSPVIAASTTDKVYVIMWYKPITSEKIKKRDVAQMYSINVKHQM